LCAGDGRRVDLGVTVFFGHRGYKPLLGYDNSETINFTYRNVLFIPPTSYKTGFGPEAFRLLNKNKSTVITALYTPQDITTINSIMSQLFTPPKNTFFLAVNKNYIKPYSNLTTIVYDFIHNGYVTPDQPQVFYGGDSFISNFSYYELDRDKLEGNNKKVFAKHMNWFFLESDINFDMAHSGNIGCLRRLQYDPRDLEEAGNRAISYTLDRVAEIDTTGKCFLARGSTCRQEPFYNFDFNKKSYEKTLPQLAPNENNYCSTCDNKYPYRVIASEKSFQTEQRDARQLFKANNFTDLLGKDGDIQRLFVDKDKLYCLTERAFYIIPTKTQTMRTNENSIYVGTGEIFSVEPKKISTTDYSYGGTQDK
jgi:hypothetical protein